ncbi:hypothetical protein BTA37_10600 [Priestia megaterium]|uniref:hypothetical protein n=1 Tax=Priestia megaterium TaxID=1404 RepID=UPI00094C610D|nr:hypothetical protein [Priestia megaterium]OLO38310.1 hypothetical protein BTA37_10600 [Priestia megaterium]
MNKKIRCSLASCITIIGALSIYFLFFSYDKFYVTKDENVLNTKLLSDTYGNYECTEMAHQTKYDSKKYFRAFGKTQNGDFVYAIKGDHKHKQVLLIENTEMPMWFLYARQ